MKKMMIFAIAALGLTMAACNGKKAEQPQTATTEKTVVTDTAFQNKAAGDYHTEQRPDRYNQKHSGLLQVGTHCQT